jgi:predicted membrane channel-forming protein YqfA (hemolysin III family)
MRGFIAAFVLIVIGIAIAAAAGGRVALVAIGVFVAGVGSVVGVSAAFWVIGKSEDRDRERGGS